MDNKETKVKDRTEDDLIKDFKFIQAICLSIYKEKTSDYGNSFDDSMNKLGLFYAVGRLHDKINRVINLCKKGEECTEVKDESIDDTLLDLANYAIMTLSYRYAKRGQLFTPNSVLFTPDKE